MIHYLIFFKESTIQGAYFTEHWYKKFSGDIEEHPILKVTKPTTLTPEALEAAGYIRNPHLGKKDSTGFSIEEMIQSEVAVLTAIFKDEIGVVTRMMRYELVHHSGPEAKIL